MYMDYKDTLKKRTRMKSNIKSKKPTKYSSLSGRSSRPAEVEDKYTGTQDWIDIEEIETNWYSVKTE